jgi:predicted transcriptional regulator of viral defense system
MAENRNTILGINLTRTLAERGYRIFNTEVAETVGKELGMRDQYVSECLYYLKQSNWVQQLRKGLFALPPALLSGSVINEYEIAMAIVEPAAICYLSALHYHQLTQQAPRNIFVLTTTNSKRFYDRAGKNRGILINGVHYNFLSVKQEHYFGIDQVWIGDAKVNVTDLERTLLDSITRPKFCGGFSESIHYFSLALRRLNTKRLIDYANKLGDTAIRRLGWMLEQVGASKATLVLLQRNFTGHVKLNASGDRKGKYNSKWGVIENI